MTTKVRIENDGPDNVKVNVMSVHGDGFTYSTEEIEIKPKESTERYVYAGRYLKIEESK